MKKTIIILISALTTVSLNAQIIQYGDSVRLNLTTYTGSIQWQQSADSINYSDIAGAISDSAVVTPAATAWYRAMVTDGSCNPWYSDTTKVTVNQTFTCGTDSVQDADGIWYNTVLIGAQCWFKENMRTTKYPDSTAITKGAVTHGDASWGTDQAWYSCPPNVTNNGEDCAAAASLGMLYQWSAAMDGSIVEGTQGVCPTGWHVPTDIEWKTLEGSLGMTVAEQNNTSWRGTNEGSKMADHVANQNWTAGTLTGDADFGSSGLDLGPSGDRFTNGNYYFRGTNATVWSSTESGSNAWRRSLNYSNAQVDRLTASKVLGLSVRCIKDCPLPATPDTINGSSNVNTGQTGVSYSIDTVPGAASYTWTVPLGATVASGQGTDSITVDFGSASGNVCVTADNSCGTGSAYCLAVTVFNCGIDSVQDADGNWYNTVLIGTQCWFKENLRTTKYPDSSPITKGAVTDGDASWGTDQAWYSCPPNVTNNGEDCAAAASLGMLYQWSAAMDGDTIEGAQGVCPTSWHVPTHDEWTTLEQQICNDNGGGTCSADFPYDVTTTGWLGSNGEGSDMANHVTGQNWTANTLTGDINFGLSGLDLGPSGYRTTNGNYNLRGYSAYVWSSAGSGSNAWCRLLYSNNAQVYRKSDSKPYGFSVRCIKDN